MDVSTIGMALTFLLPQILPRAAMEAAEVHTSAISTTTLHVNGGLLDVRLIMEAEAAAVAAALWGGVE